MAIPLAAAIIPGALKTGLGVYQAVKASKELKRLGKMPEYGITPEQQKSYDRAERMAKTGYSPQERASFAQRLARQNNTAFQRGITLGGGSLSKALNSAILSNNIGAELDFAAGDAQLKRSNIRYADAMGQQITGQRNRNTAQQLAYRMMLEQNLGRAKQIGINNAVEGVSGVPYTFMQQDYINSLNPQETVDATDYSVENINPSSTGMTLSSRKPLSLTTPSKGYTGLKTPTFGMKSYSPVYSR